MHARVLSREIEGKNSPHPKTNPAYLQIYCYHYNIKVTILEEQSRRDEVNAHEVGITCLRTRQGR